MSDRLRNHVVLAPEQPTIIEDPALDSGQRPPADGDLWVDSNYFVIYVYDSKEGTPEEGGWVGVTDKSNTGSIVYFSDKEPDLTDIYPALNNLPDGIDGIQDNAEDGGGNSGTLDISPLPGTMWYDTTNKLLKIYLVGVSWGAGSWVSVTSAHYMTQAIQDGLTSMDTRVAALEAQVDTIING